MTETVIHATRNDFHQHYPDGIDGPARRPATSSSSSTTTPGEVCAPGEIGELWVRGTRGIQLFLEYFDNDEANAKSFTDDGWFKTGDIVTMSRRRLPLLPRPRQGRAQGRRRERVGPRGRGRLPRRCPASPTSRSSARSTTSSTRSPSPSWCRRRARPTTSPQQIIDHCAAQLADFKMPARRLPRRRVPDAPRSTRSRRTSSARWPTPDSTRPESARRRSWKTASRRSCTWSSPRPPAAEYGAERVPRGARPPGGRPGVVVADCVPGRRDLPRRLDDVDDARVSTSARPSSGRPPPPDGVLGIHLRRTGGPGRARSAAARRSASSSCSSRRRTRSGRRCCGTGPTSCTSTTSPRRRPSTSR